MQIYLIHSIILKHRAGMPAELYGLLISRKESNAMDTMKNEELIIYNTDDGKADVKLYSKDCIIWMNQQQMALLFDTSNQLISHHIANVLQEKELEEKLIVKDYLTAATDGKNYNVTYYALPMVLAVGFRVRSVRGCLLIVYFKQQV